MDIKNNGYSFFIEKYGIRPGSVDYKFRQEVFPINTSSLKITGDRSDNNIFLRKKLNGDIVLVNNDFVLLRKFETENFYSTFYFIIEKKCNNIYYEIYRGKFYLSDTSFDLNRCTCTINNLNTFDEYSCILDNSKIEYNLFQIPDVIKVTGNLMPFQVETIEANTTTKCAGIFSGNCFYPTVNGAYPATVAYNSYYALGWILLSQKYEFVDLKTSTFKLTAKWQRFYIDTLNDINGTPVPPTVVLPVDDWINGGTTSINSSLATHWIAPASNFIDPTMAPVRNNFNGCNNFYLINSLDNAPNLSAYQQTFDQNRKFVDVLKTFATHCNYEFKSTLFESTINPVTGIKNRLPDLLISSKYFAAYATPPEPMYSLIYTFEDIQNVLLNMFNAYWFIEKNTSGNYVFRIEHISYFNNYNVNIDISTKKDINKYSYNLSNIYALEKWSFKNHSFPDFIGTPIIYPIHSSSDSEKTYDLSKFCTEIVTVSSTTSILDDGFVILDIKDGKIYEEIGYLTGNVLANMALSVSNLQNDYFKWDRQILQGTMNNHVQTFLSAKRIKKQNKFNISFCNCELPNWNNKIKTILGDGFLDNYEYDIMKNILSLEISYNL